MREWLTTKEIAGLPVLPTTTRGVLMRAKHECWISQKRPKGKGREYHYSNLPEEAIKALCGYKKPRQRITSWLCKLFGGRHA